MFSKRSNGKTLHATHVPVSEACFDAMQRHHARSKQAAALRRDADHSTELPRDAAMPVAGGGNGNGSKTIPATPPGADGGDILYGAAAIARFMFSVDFAEHPTRARRRVFNLWAFYEKRQERSGFFKLKGALCLSKSQWRKYHGLD